MPKQPANPFDFSDPEPEERPPSAVPVRPAPAAKRPGRRFPVWMLAIVIPAACLVLCCVIPAGALLAYRMAGDMTTAKECGLGDEARFGDLGVTVTQAKVESFTSTTAAGRMMVHQPALVIRIRFKNYNPNRIIDAGPQVESASLTDDVGNEYKGIKAVNEWGLDNTIDGQTPPGKVQPVRSDDGGGDVLVFGRPVEGASMLTLTLDASQYGGFGKLRVRISKSAWK